MSTSSSSSDELSSGDFGREAFVGASFLVDLVGARSLFARTAVVFLADAGRVFFIPFLVAEELAWLALRPGELLSAELERDAESAVVSRGLVAVFAVGAEATRPGAAFVRLVAGGLVAGFRLCDRALELVATLTISTADRCGSGESCMSF